MKAKPTGENLTSYSKSREIKKKHKTKINESKPKDRNQNISTK